ncbi:MAG: hypothetical protein QM270_10240 [Bacillota bacterium]|nr:hypothetical protein [Bacillota bacterium]
MTIDQLRRGQEIQDRLNELKLKLDILNKSNQLFTSDELKVGPYTFGVAATSISMMIELEYEKVVAEVAVLGKA